MEGHLKSENKKDKEAFLKRASGGDHSLMKPNWLSSGKKSRHRHSNSSDRISLEKDSDKVTLRIKEDENEVEKKEELRVVETVHFVDPPMKLYTNADLSQILDDHPDVTGIRLFLNGLKNFLFF